MLLKCAISPLSSFVLYKLYFHFILVIFFTPKCLATSLNEIYQNENPSFKFGNAFSLFWYHLLLKGGIGDLVVFEERSRRMKYTLVWIRYMYWGNPVVLGQSYYCDVLHAYLPHSLICPCFLRHSLPFPVSGVYRGGPHHQMEPAFGWRFQLNGIVLTEPLNTHREL